MTNAPAVTFPRGSAKPLDAIYDVALLDLDGTVYLSGAAIPGAPEALRDAGRSGMRLAYVTNNAFRTAPEALRDAGRSGMRLAYVTNNAFRTPAAIAELLTSFGVPASPEDIVTSAQAAAHMLADRLPAGAPVLVVGGSGLRMAVRERGLRPVTTAADQPLAVVEGFSPTTSYSLLAEGGLAVAAGALFVLSNSDRTLPSSRGNQPGNGALAQVIIHATGVQPLVAGKPDPPLHHESVQRTGAQHPLAVGDRLDTDIEGAQRVGADSLLVMTGVSGPADAVLAPPGQRPTYLAEGLAGLNQPHPEVANQDGKFSCGGWTARWDGQRLDLAGGGERIDGLRALCAAAWSADGVTAEGARAAVQLLDGQRLTAAAACGPARSIPPPAVTHRVC